MALEDLLLHPHHRLTENLAVIIHEIDPSLHQDQAYHRCRSDRTHRKDPPITEETIHHLHLPDRRTQHPHQDQDHLKTEVEIEIEIEIETEKMLLHRRHQDPRVVLIQIQIPLINGIEELQHCESH